MSEKKDTVVPEVVANEPVDDRRLRRSRLKRGVKTQSAERRIKPGI